MKYLWLIFILCLAALIAQIKLSPPEENPFADGRLACMPMPPEVPRPALVMLPAPEIQHIPLASPPRVEATSIEIFNPQQSSGLMVETRQADNFDWGIARSLPVDAPVQLAYAAEPRLVKPVPVNTPIPTPPPPVVPDLSAALQQTAAPWSPALARMDADNQLLALAATANLAGVPTSATSDSPELSIVPPPAEGIVDTGTLKLYPTPGNEPVETASLEPAKLISSSHVPNLYLPDGALDEEGAKLTLISPDLHLYELPDQSSKAAPFTLKSGDQVRPLTRLRNVTGYDWIKFDRDGKSWWAQAEYFIRVDPRNRKAFPEGNLAFGKERVDKDSALPVDYQPDDLREVAGKFTFGAKHVHMRAEAAEALERMGEAAEKEGLKLRVFSGFRDFSYQKKLYLDALHKQGPKQDGTAAPGYSEHQLGTTADISSDNRRTILLGTFGETPEGRWLHENSERFGFRKSYTQENTKEVGYKPEPWHFRYIGAPKEKADKDAVAAK